MAKDLIIVESTKKARTIKGLLGGGITVKATAGHILEMPRDDIHVDLETFQPTLHLMRGKGKLLDTLRRAANDADNVYLATDPDREGEAIAQHVAARLGRNLAERVQRIAFTAITEADIRAALAAPRRIDANLVAAQTARRVIDRLVGYMASPVLWAGLSGRKRLSAGRVQSPALWLVVTRERAIRAFVPEKWWSLDAELSRQADPEKQRFWARLIKVGHKKPSLKTAVAANRLKALLDDAAWQVLTVKKGRRLRRPYPPFTTDSLQQAASSQLGMSPKMTMSLAQQLYEGVKLEDGKAAGLITYMRTDSVAVAPEAQQAARAVVTRYWGSAYLPPKPPTYATRDKTAQEAHEAIRPTDPERTPKQIEAFLEPRQYQLYRLIWRRFIASQMKPAEYDTVTVDIEPTPRPERLSADMAGPYLFRAGGSTLRFAGFLKVYGVDEDAEQARSRRRQKDDEPDEAPLNQTLPALQAGDPLQLHQLLPKEHVTKPPARYTEAGLIGELKKQGLGRPSTYATIIETLKQRQYVQVQQKRMHPTPLGEQVCQILETYISTVVDVAFTARMEDDLDAIAQGKRSRQTVMTDFYGPFKALIDQALDQARQNRQQAKPVSGDGRGKRGTRGRSGSRERGGGRRSQRGLPQSERAGQPCPQCKTGELVVRRGKYGPFIGCTRYKEGCKYTEKLVKKMLK